MPNSDSSRPMDFWAYLAVCFPFGLAPKAPGTFGSLPGVLVGWALSSLVSSLLFKIIILLGMTYFAFVVIYKTEKLWNSHDDKSIVIDEVVGQAIPLAFLPFSWTTAILAFVLFRFFDISKPSIIGWADRKVHGAWGTLLDDVFAGIFTLIVMLALSMTPLL